VRLGVEREDRQRAGGRAGQHRVLPAVRVDVPRDQVAECALTVGHRRTRRHDDPPSGRIATSGHDQTTAAHLRLVGRGEVYGELASEHQLPSGPHERRPLVHLGHGGHRKRCERHGGPGRGQALGQPVAGRRTPVAADPPPGERVAGQRGDRGGHPLPGDLVEHRGGHPQQPAPDATASAFAVLPQHPPDAAASAAVPQQVPSVATSGRSSVAVGGLPQQPSVPVTFNAAAGSPVKPPLVSFAVSLTIKLPAV
jgi:hypothetical protein